jgi:tRNA uridine 5-carbamoylmethylation protein Kti12
MVSALLSLKVSKSSMALIVMCGQPCSGKSAAAACLAAALRSSSSDLTVRIIDESSLHLGRNDSYKGIGYYYMS